MGVHAGEFEDFRSLALSGVRERLLLHSLRHNGGAFKLGTLVSTFGGGACMRRFKRK